jgi:putative redox protein
MSIVATWSQEGATTACSISEGSIAWRADIEPGLGGAGTHPTPHALLDSSLAACTALTIQVYAKRKRLLVDRVRVEVSREAAAGVYRLDRRIYLQANLSESQRLDLLRVANACPIHKVLTGKIETTTELVAVAVEPSP